MSKTFASLPTIQWAKYNTLDDWSGLLKELLDLGKSAPKATEAERILLADTLSLFADHSDVDGQLAAVIEIDKVAREAAIALRNTVISDVIAGLKESAAKYEQISAEMQAQTSQLKKDAKSLRLEHITEAVDSLTKTVASLKKVRDALDQKNDKVIVDSLVAAVSDIQKLRDKLEKTA